MTSSDIPNVPGIYCITCTVTSKFYIGSSINLHQRQYNHFRELQRNEHDNQYMQRAWNKYGSDAFIFEVLELVLVPEMLTTREQHWLDTLKPFGNKGFNMTPIAGSTLGRKFSPEAKEKIRIKALGRKISEEARQNMAESHRGSKRSAETRAKMSAAQIGNTKSLGKKLSPERVEQMRRINLGKKMSEESKRKMSESQKGRKHSDETIEKIRRASQGREQSTEARAKKSASVTKATLGKRKMLIVTSPEGIEYSVVGIHQFCREHNLDRSTLLRVAKGRYNHHKGWKARFPD